MKYLCASFLLTVVFTPAFGFYIHNLDYENSPYENKKMPLVGEPIKFLYQIANISQGYPYTISITNLDEGKRIFYTKGEYDASLDEPRDIFWDFTPETEGLYSVEVSESSGKTAKYVFAAAKDSTFKQMARKDPTILETKSPMQQFRMGMDPKEVRCKDGLYLAVKTSIMPICVSLDTLKELRQRNFVASEFIEYEKIGHFLSETKFKEILADKNISYKQDDFVIIEGMMLPMGIPEVGYCGYVMSDEQEDYWFSSSSHGFELLNFEVHEKNPEPCSPGMMSCFCFLQTQLVERTTSELTYFTKSEEQSFGKSVSQYLNETKIANVSNQFIIGKYNLESDSADAHFCGAFTWGAGLKHFEGYIKKGQVVDFSLASDKQKLCAISDNARTFTFDESSIVKDSFEGQ